MRRRPAPPPCTPRWPATRPSTCRPQGAEVLPLRRAAAAQHRGPGDAHSRKEWVWRRADYEALFAERPARRAAAARARPSTSGRPRHTLASPMRVPEREADRRRPRSGRPGLLELDPPLVPTASSRSATSWRPSSSSRSGPPTAGHRSGATVDLGRYGRAARAPATRYFPREQVHVLRYRDLVDEPGRPLDAHRDVPRGRPGRSRRRCRPRTCRRWVDADPSVNRVLRVGRARRAPGSASSPPPQVWRTAERPLRGPAAAGRARTAPTSPPRHGPRSSSGTSSTTSSLLSEVTGRDFDDWLGQVGRGDVLGQEVVSAVGPASPRSRGGARRRAARHVDVAEAAGRVR